MTIRELIQAGADLDMNIYIGAKIFDNNEKYLGYFTNKDFERKEEVILHSDYITLKTRLEKP